MTTRRSSKRRRIAVWIVALHAAIASVATATPLPVTVPMIPPNDLGVPTPAPQIAPTGTLLRTIGTSAGRVGTLPPGPATKRRVRILVVGLGIQRALFPAALQQRIVDPSGAGLSDGFGSGTLAASAILQVLPQAELVSRSLPFFPDGRMDLDALAGALTEAKNAPSAYDAVLLAFPPQFALHPLANLATVSYGDAIGTGLDMVEEAVLANPAPTDKPVVGIPLDDRLREGMFAKANFKQRDAVERYARQSLGFLHVVNALKAAHAAGVPVIAPAGDFGLRDRTNNVVPVYNQSVWGLSARPEVITVGASYVDGNGVTRLSPGSGIGPTLGLHAKPDFLAPSDVIGLLPVGSVLGKGWPDAGSGQVPSPTLEWGSVRATICATLPEGKCVLQGSSMVSAAVAAANIAAFAAYIGPSAFCTDANTAHQSACKDLATEMRPNAISADVLLGLAQAAASRDHARAAGDERAAYPWEEGAGVLEGMRFLGADPAAVPVPLKRMEAGEIECGKGTMQDIRLWNSSPEPVTWRAAMTSFAGADPSGATRTALYSDPGTVIEKTGPHSIRLTFQPFDYQPGLYAGRVRLDGPSSGVYEFPMSAIHDLCPRFRASYAYNKLQNPSGEGEAAEHVSLMLMPGTPAKNPLLGSAFKFLQEDAVNPLDSGIRYAVTFDGDPATHENGTGIVERPADRGVAVIRKVPPGFWRTQLTSNFSLDGMQTCPSNGSIGRCAPGQPRPSCTGCDPLEPLGLKLAGSATEGALVPGHKLLVSSVPTCADLNAAGGHGTRGPLGGDCLTGNGSKTDSETGFCELANPTTHATFWLYCDEASMAMPAAVVSRAIHIISDTDPQTGSPKPVAEWSACPGIDADITGKPLSFTDIVAKAQTACPVPTSRSTWSIGTTKPVNECAAPADDTFAHPAAGIMATYDNNPLATSNPSVKMNLPIAVMTYKFGIPDPALYARVALNMSYVADNAIVVAIVQTGMSDAGGGLVVADPRINLDPIFKTAGRRNSYHSEWIMMPAGGTSGTISLLIIPTTWVHIDPRDSSPLARVGICDVALRVSTFAKASWGPATEDASHRVLQSITQQDSGELSHIDPNSAVGRAAFTGSRFEDLGIEREGMMYAIHVPKNNFSSSDIDPTHAVNRVSSSSPPGRAGPAYLCAIARGALPPGCPPALSYRALDPGYPDEQLACSPDATDKFAAAFCQALLPVKMAFDIASPDLNGLLTINGRFFAIAPRTLNPAAPGDGSVRWVLNDADGTGAVVPSSLYFTANRSAIAVEPFYGDFPSDGLNGPSAAITNGTVAINTPSNDGNSILAVRVVLPAGGERSLAVELGARP